MDHEREDGEFAGLDEAAQRLEDEIEDIQSRGQDFVDSVERRRLARDVEVDAGDHDEQLKNIEAAARRARKSSGIKRKDQVTGKRPLPRSVTGREIDADYSGLRKGFLMLAMIVGGLVVGLGIGQYVGSRTGSANAAGIGAVIGFIVGFGLYFISSQRLQDD